MDQLRQVKEGTSPQIMNHQKFFKWTEGEKHDMVINFILSIFIGYSNCGSQQFDAPESMESSTCSSSVDKSSVNEASHVIHDQPMAEGDFIQSNVVIV